MGIQKRGSFILSFFVLFRSSFALPIAQQINRDLMGIGFSKRLGKRIKKERKEKYMAWAVIRNPDSRDYNEIFVFVIKTFSSLSRF